MRLSQNLILLPVFLQVGLTLAVLLIMGMRRQASMGHQKKSIQDMALPDDHDWERPAELAARNFRNQFELPVLFYAVTGFALATRNVDLALFVVAWIFVLSRVVHSAVHLTTNVVIYRGSAYTIGFVALAAMWVVLAADVFRAGF